MKDLLFSLLFGLLILGQANAQTLQVPANYPTIQAAINDAQNGDTVLVQPGEYFENIRFKGKSIVLTSRFFLTNSADDIANTIINGSQPAHPDTASCILIVDGENASTVVQGFTITGGKGTKWLDPHGAGTYREGGGILTEGTSPVIQFNIIHDNVISVVGPGLVSNGGGGIRCGDGSPIVQNNWVHHNVGRYGGGIVFNYCTGTIRNNLVSYNEGGQDYGGGGLWFTGTNQNTIVEIDNNTIVNNKVTGSGSYGGKGGGIFVFSIKLVANNNIVWGNSQTAGGPVAKLAGGAVTLSYSDVEGGYTGTDNFNLDPQFAGTTFFTLKYRSPCVDAGDPTINDLTNISQQALFPSLCGMQSDLGAFGGQLASALPYGVQPITRLFDKISTGALVTMPSDSRSVNFVDVNNDGWEDVFISNGPEGGAKNLLYLNDGAGNFSAVNDGDLVSHVEPFDGATFADADNDGNLDAYAVTWYGEKNFLYSGNGDSTFSYLSAALPSTTSTYSETASWGDYDNDGLPDLYVTNSDGTKKNLLFHNEGGMVFSPVTSGAPVTDANTSRCVNWTDYDGDGDLDIFVTNESNLPDDLYRNDGAGVFTKITGTDAPGQSSTSSMSSSWGDVDNDGDLDLFVANSAFYAPQNNQLFINENGSFTGVAIGDLVTDGGCSYGSNFDDYDNDGDIDLVVSNGFCNGSIQNFLYENDGLGNFSRNLTAIEDLSTPCSYGAAWGDVNNDGFPDLSIATCRNTSGSPLPNDLFYLNRGNCNNWLKIKLTGTVSNRSAIGAKVWVRANINGQEVTQLREISAQSGYCGQNSLIAHFGLGNAETADQVTIEFLGGNDTILTDVPVNQMLQITEPLATATEETTEMEAFSLAIAPNPVSDTFQVSLHMQRPLNSFRLRLTDITGRVVFEKKQDLKGMANWSDQLSARTIGLPAGQYYLEVSGGGFSTTKVLVVQ